MNRTGLFIAILLITVTSLFAIPPMPAPRGAGTVVMSNDTIYYLGGSNDWNGSTCYRSIFRFDGTTWDSLPTQIPDVNTWGITSVIVNDTIYLLDGWRGGQGTIRSYAIRTQSWTTNYPSSGNTLSWGPTTQLIGRFIYNFNGYGQVFRFSLDSLTWSSRTSAIGTPIFDGYLGSVTWNGEIYLLGYQHVNSFQKYNPTTDIWTLLSPPVVEDDTLTLEAASLAVLNERIYVGAAVRDGGSSNTEMDSLIYSYNPLTDVWQVDSVRMPSLRAWSATTMYGGGWYVFGGLTGPNQNSAIDSVTQIVPYGFTSIGNRSAILPASYRVSVYPNPFNSVLRIKIPGNHSAQLRIVNVNGQLVEHFSTIGEPASQTSITWKPNSLSTGTYFLQTDIAGEQVITPIMYLK
ncbi:MAG: T9SS type A sorting domain-containing protein [bacterium]|nr:T9SS type A sorting domain-containing protein [bacterium]